MEDPEDFIRKKVPERARWEPDVIVNEGEEQESDPYLWIRVTDGIRLDEEGAYWMSEHGIKSAYTDVIKLETQTFSSADRPWRCWEGCRFYGDVLRLARAHVQKMGITCEVAIKKEGRTYMRTKPPCLACPSEHCKKKWNSGGQDWPEAVGFFWTHLQGSSSAEEAEALAGGDRTVMVHPTKEMINQMEVFWKKQNRREAELKLQAQGAAPSPRSAAQAKQHQREFLREQPRTLEKKGKGPAPRPAGSGSTKTEQKEKRKPAASGATSKSKKKMEPVAEDDIWEDDTWGGKMDEEMLRAWDVLPGTSIQQARKQRAPIPPAANVAPKVAAKKDMAASGASASSQNSQGPRMPFFHKYDKKKQAAGQKDGGGEEAGNESEDEDSEDKEPPQRSEEDEEEDHEGEDEQKEEDGEDGA